jgi:hypothetical protein
VANMFECSIHDDRKEGGGGKREREREREKRGNRIAERKYNTCVQYMVTKRRKGERGRRGRRGRREKRGRGRRRGRGRWEGK